MLYNWLKSKYNKYNSSREFLKREIKKIIKNNPNIKIKYYFDCFDEDHFLCFKTQEELDSIDIKEMDLRFIKKFPNELLSFTLLEDYLEFGDSGTLIFEN